MSEHPTEQTPGTVAHYREDGLLMWTHYRFNFSREQYREYLLSGYMMDVTGVDGEVWVWAQPAPSMPEEREWRTGLPSLMQMEEATA